MKQDHASFTSSPSASSRRIAGAYHGDVADRVRRFLPMVRRLAWHVNGTGRAGIELEDLIQAGLVALTECAQKHAGPTEDGFAAYAKLRVRGAMVDLIRRTVPLSRGAAVRGRQLREKEGELRGLLGRDPTVPELARALGIDDAQLEAMRGTSLPLRFDAIDEVYSDHDAAFADQTPDSLAIMQDEEQRGAIVQAIADLPERLRLVISLYFVEELNLAEIAQVLQVSIPRVHQLKAQALGKLRESLQDVVTVL
jgi:RNA polymerase sigma factor for flagellar operon FliA